MCSSLSPRLFINHVIYCLGHIRCSAWPWWHCGLTSCPLTDQHPFCHRYLCKPAMKPAVPGASASLCNLIPFLKVQFLAFFLIFHINPKRYPPPLSRAKHPPWCQPGMGQVRLCAGHWLSGRAAPCLPAALPRVQNTSLLSTTPPSPWGPGTWESAVGFTQVILKQNKEKIPTNKKKKKKTPKKK